jgi:hypothetical protein
MLSQYLVHQVAAECLLWANFCKWSSAKKNSTKEISAVALVGLEGNVV